MYQLIEEKIEKIKELQKEITKELSDIEKSFLRIFKQKFNTNLNMEFGVSSFTYSLTTLVKEYSIIICISKYILRVDSVNIIPVFSVEYFPDKKIEVIYKNVIESHTSDYVFLKTKEILEEL